MCINRISSALPLGGDPAELRVEVYLGEMHRSIADGLAEFGVTALWRPLPPHTSQIQDASADGLARDDKVEIALPNHVALLDATVMPESDFGAWIAYFRRQKLGVVLLTESTNFENLSFLQTGVNGIVSVQASSSHVAFSLWTAHEQAKQLQIFEKRVSALEAKLVEQKVIGQAKEIIAAQLNISESAALKHLRKEARQRRRTIYELALVILEANRIVCQTLPRAT